MLKTAQNILSQIPTSVSYADVRIVEQDSEEIATKEGRPVNTNVGHGRKYMEEKSHSS